MTITITRTQLELAARFGELTAIEHYDEPDRYHFAPVIDLWREIDQLDAVFRITGEKLTADDEDFWLILDAIENAYYDSPVWEEEEEDDITLSGEY